MNRPFVLAIGSLCVGLMVGSGANACGSAPHALCSRRCPKGCRAGTTVGGRHGGAGDGGDLSAANLRGEPGKPVVIRGAGEGAGRDPRAVSSNRRCVCRARTIGLRA